MMLPEFPIVVAVNGVGPAAWDCLDITLYVVVP